MLFTATALLFVPLVSATMSDPFNLKTKGYDGELNDAYVTPMKDGDGNFWAFSDRTTVVNAYYMSDDHLYYRTQEGDVVWFRGAHFHDANGIPALQFSASDIDGGMGFDGEGRLSVNDNQWGWFACTGHNIKDMDDKQVLAFWDNQDDADLGRCKPVTVEKFGEVKPL